ncbi:MAG: sialate O-acetylesterase, partial [Mucilaginibacter sp.]
AVAGNFNAHTIMVKNNTSTITLTNILIGDVWFCAGQSNMDMPVDNQSFIGYPGVTNYQQEIAAANFPALRYYEAAAAFKIKPEDNTNGTWRVCNPTNVKNFSAIAYFFGRELHLKLNIPVGLVVSAAAGASCQAFMSQPALEADEVLRRKYLDLSRGQIDSQAEVDSDGFFSNVLKPTLIYNGMIYPLINLSIKGYTWYQGESNIGDGSVYTYLCTTMIRQWRKDFKQGNLPFNFVQIAPNGSATGSRTAFFREAQEDMLKLDNTGMALTMDVGEVNNVHPSNKRPVGERLAKNALHSTYGKTDVAYLGPTYLSHIISNDTVKVSFTTESTGAGLTTNDGQAPRHFAIAGIDKIFYPATAAIVGKQVWAVSNKVKKPVAIRYAFNDGVVTNLSNKEGLPAVPFRTDRFKYTACSFAYAQYTGYSNNCSKCSITAAVSSTDADTISAAIFKINNTAGAYAEQHLYFQHPGIKGDIIKLGLKTPVALSNTDLLSKIELLVFNGDTLKWQLALNNSAVKLIALADNRYNISLTATGSYTRIAVRLNAGKAALLGMDLSFAVQQFVAPVSNIANNPVCANSSAKITIAQPGTYNWYENPIGGLPVFTGSNFTTPNLANGKTYYVQDSRNSCETSERTAVAINVQAAPVKPAVIINNGGKLITGNKAVLKISNPLPTNAYKWYYTNSSSTPFFTGVQFETPAITVDTAVYVEAIAGSCTSERTRIAIKVSPKTDSLKLSIYPNPTPGEINFLFN